MLPPGLLVVHDTGRGGEDDLAERTGGEELGDPVLDAVNSDVEPGGYDAGLVQSAGELNDDLVTTVVVDDLELADVAWGSAYIQARYAGTKWRMTRERMDVLPRSA